jgi:hypothetical protein
MRKTGPKREKVTRVWRMLPVQVGVMGIVNIVIKERKVRVSAALRVR